MGLIALPIGLCAAIGLIIAVYAQDTAMYVHGLIFFIGSILAGFAVLKTSVGASKVAVPEGKIDYNDGVIRAGVIASTFWGVVGFLVGLTIAFQLAFPVLNFDLPWTNFGRLRPLHTSAVIFAFGGNVLIIDMFC